MIPIGTVALRFHDKQERDLPTSVRRLEATALELIAIDVQRLGRCMVWTYRRRTSVKTQSYGGDWNTATVDWNLIGAADNQTQLCFYDAKGVTRSSDHIKVWMKCIKQQAIEDIKTDSDLGKELIAKSAHALLTYELLIITLGRMSEKGLSSAIYYGMAADWRSPSGQNPF
jgi:hypothetical protein